jgi:hypothetical protein
MMSADGISAWEDEGGALRGEPAARPSSHARSDRSLDRDHDSDARGEHRYPDVHQTGAERQSRQHRDDLKKSLAAPRWPHGGRW